MQSYKTIYPGVQNCTAHLRPFIKETLVKICTSCWLCTARLSHDKWSWAAVRYAGRVVLCVDFIFDIRFWQSSLKCASKHLHARHTETHVRVPVVWRACRIPLDHFGASRRIFNKRNEKYMPFYILAPKIFFEFPVLASFSRAHMSATKNENFDR